MGGENNYVIPLIEKSSLQPPSSNGLGVVWDQTTGKFGAGIVGLPPGVILPYGGTSAPAGYLLCNGAAISRSTYSALFAAIGSNFGSGDGSTTFNLPDFRGRFLRGKDGGTARDPDRASRTAMNSGGNTGDNVGSVQTTATKRPTTNLTSNTVATHTHAVSSSGAHTHTTAKDGNHTHTTGTNSTTHTHPQNIAGGLSSAGEIPMVRNFIGSINGNMATGSSLTSKSQISTSAEATTHTHAISSSGSHEHAIPSGGAHTHTTDGGGSHSHAITGGGDNESRPPNANVEYIIKY